MQSFRKRDCIQAFSHLLQVRRQVVPHTINGLQTVTFQSVIRFRNGFAVA